MIITIKRIRIKSKITFGIWRFKITIPLVVKKKTTVVITEQ